MKTAETTAAELPDDPRDCCRAAMKILISDTLDDQEALICDVLAVTFGALSAEPDVPSERLRSLVARAEDVFRELLASLDEVWALIRHGTTDYRANDAEQEAIRLAREKGREPPYPMELMSRVVEIEIQRRQKETGGAELLA